MQPPAPTRGLTALCVLLLQYGASAAVDVVPDRPILVRDQGVLAYSPSSGTDAIEFYPVTDEVTASFGDSSEKFLIDIQVANGNVPENTADWESVLVTYFRTEGGFRGSCTGSLVGPNTLLTAAHCLVKPDNSLVEARINIHGSLFEITCTAHPQYLASTDARIPRNDHDYALCLLDGNVQDLIYEVVAFRQALALNDRVVIAGYGCTEVYIDENSIVRHNSAFGEMRMGEDNIAILDIGMHHWQQGSLVMTHSLNVNDPVSCPGDSGGPVFNSLASAREIVGVNSAILGQRIDGQDEFFTIIAPVGHSTFRSFVTDWKNDHPGAVICDTENRTLVSGCRSFPFPDTINGASFQ